MNIEYYINRFFSIASKSTVRTRQRELLERLLSTEEQTLTAEQQIQTLKNAGVKVGKLSLAKGTHEITFDKPFLAPSMLNFSLAEEVLPIPTFPL